jgi:c-di-GMP-binding flagellar brake protein YcgR
VTPETGDGAFEAYTVDLSLGGVGLASPAPLPTGARVALTFYLVTGADEVLEQVDGRVVNLRYDDDASHIGVEFVEPLSPRSAPALTRAIEGS